jgi:hypothetical protein
VFLVVLQVIAVDQDVVQECCAEDVQEGK